MDVTIENPLILILGAVFSAIPFKNRCQLVVIQKLVLFYLACVFVNLVSDKYFTISAWWWSVNISYGILGVVFLSGIVFLKKKTMADNERQLYREILVGWWIVLGIIAIHMVALFFILKGFYGYGYEHDLKSMGAVCGCFVLFVCMWAGLSLMKVRLFWGICLAVGIGLIARGGLL